MATPQIVVFDLGKVLLDFDYSIAARRIAAHARIAADELKHFIDHSPLLFRFETGLITQQQFFDEICALSGFCGNLEEFGTFFSDIFVPIAPMVALQNELRARGIPTYIFSNTNDLAISHIRRRFPFFSNFEDYILSYEHGAMKPDARLYEVVEKRSRRRGSEILYLDDRAENIAAGATRGWQVILQESPDTTRAAIKRLGLLNHSP
jgi:2-haloacid dehalogenase